MNAEGNMTTGTAPEGQLTKSKTAKKRASKAASSKPKAKKSSKVNTGAKLMKAATPPKSDRVTKTVTVLELLRRDKGATIARIAKATGWQNQSIRGFISGTVTKKVGFAVESSKNEVGLSNRITVITEAVQETRTAFSSSAVQDTLGFASELHGVPTQAHKPHIHGVSTQGVKTHKQ